MILSNINELSIKKQLLILFLVALLFSSLRSWSSQSKQVLEEQQLLNVEVEGEEDVKTFLVEEAEVEKKEGQAFIEKESDAEEQELDETYPSFQEVEEDKPSSSIFKASASYEPAPRTHLGPYNEIRRDGTKYFIYSPSGGFNNQREELAYAIEIGKLLNRTLYVPMAGRHTNFFQSYERLAGTKDLFPMDRILDFPYLETYGVPLVPLNITLMRFVAKFIKQVGENSVEILFHPERPSQIERWHKPEVLSLRKYNKKLLFLRGRGFYHRWFASSTMTKLKMRFRYSKYLRDLAVKITENSIGKNFYAMHIRMGDYKVSYDSPHLFVQSLVRTARSRKWRTQKFPLYVATDDEKKSGEDFGPVYSAFSKVLFANHISKDLVREYRKLFPQESGLRADMMGILEQLICAQAIDFVGTSTSTFSAWIQFMRALRKYTFPELGDVTSSFSGNMTETMIDNDNEKFASQTESDSFNEILSDEEIKVELVEDTETGQQVKDGSIETPEAEH